MLRTKLWPPVVANRGIIRPQSEDELDLFLINLGPCSSLGFPKIFSRDGEAASLVSGKVFRDQITVRAAEVVDAVGPILADINLSLWNR